MSPKGRDITLNIKYTDFVGLEMKSMAVSRDNTANQLKYLTSVFGGRGKGVLG